MNYQLYIYSLWIKAFDLISGMYLNGTVLKKTKKINQINQKENFVHNI